jgi:broad specificity phosphatase PhoE
MNGTPVAQLEAARASHIDTPFPNGESYRQVVTRVDGFLKDLAREWDNGSVVVVIGHSATRWAIDYLLLGTPLEELVGVPFNWQPGWRYVLG